MAIDWPSATHRIREHCAYVRGEGQEGECLEYDHVDGTEDGIVAGQKDQPHDHEFGEQDKQPGHDHAHNAADVLDAPGLVSATSVVLVNATESSATAGRQRGVRVVHGVRMQPTHM